MMMANVFHPSIVVFTSERVNTKSLECGDRNYTAKFEQVCLLILFYNRHLFGCQHNRFKCSSSIPITFYAKITIII